MESNGRHCTCGRCSYCTSIKAIPSSDAPTRAEIRDEMAAMVGKIKTKFISAEALEATILEATKGIRDGMAAKFERELGSRDSRFLAEVEGHKKEMGERLDSLTKDGGSLDTDSLMRFATKVKNETIQEFQSNFAEFQELIKVKVAEVASTLEGKIFEWGNELQAQIQGMKDALAAIHIDVLATTPEVKPQIHLEVPEQPAPHVHVTLEESDRVTEKEIEYSQITGRPERVREKTIRIPK